MLLLMLSLRRSLHILIPIVRCLLLLRRDSNQLMTGRHQDGIQMLLWALHRRNHQLWRLLVRLVLRLELLKMLAFGDEHWTVDCVDQLHHLRRPGLLGQVEHSVTRCHNRSGRQSLTENGHIWRAGSVEKSWH